jgi:Raf kinase inhibitor-like YbhB/YbcL family protein
MRLSTDALDSSGFFDPRYTCDIDNSSPELRWDTAPENVRSFALLLEDRDAGAGDSFCHWVVYHIPKEVTHLPAGIPPQDSLPNGIRQGLNSFGKLGYAGPCPARGGGTHRYIFRLLALREVPPLSAKLTRGQLLQALDGLVLEVAEIQGRYERSIERAG